MLMILCSLGTMLNQGSESSEQSALHYLSNAQWDAFASLDWVWYAQVVCRDLEASRPEWFCQWCVSDLGSLPSENEKSIEDLRLSLHRPIANNIDTDTCVNKAEGKDSPVDSRCPASAL